MMPDREKVIKGLENCKEGGSCDGCQYDFQSSQCIFHLHTDALALLKEQEAVEPSFKQGKDGIFVWCCGSCGAYMYHIYDGIDKAKEYAKYCRQCGKAVKWK